MISHCLLPFAAKLNVKDVAATKALIACQAATCPHDDCTGLRNCQEVCRAHANAIARRTRNVERVKQRAAA